MKKNVILLVIPFFLSACMVGPNYVRPSAPTPVKYKEAGKGWKIATPNETAVRGDWWTIFHDQKLNSLEDELNNNNQNIKMALAQYRQALALVAEAKAAYFPVITGTAQYFRQRNAPGSTITNSATNSTTNTSGISTVRGANGTPFTTYALTLMGTWEPDLWGAVGRQVESNIASAQASLAQWAFVELSMQATLAQLYFEVQTLDLDQHILDENVAAYAKALQLTKNRYASGVAAESDVIQARSLVESAQAAAINNGVNRALYEHAAAVLIGRPPANFSLGIHRLKATPPPIPLECPSELLERRPDVAQAERQMAAANALIGVAISAYFPVLPLSATGSTQGPGLGPLFSLPSISWSIGGQLIETLFDGGLRTAKVNAARANYDATIATYRQTVLAAFQDVEDNLATLRILKKQSVVQKSAVIDATKALKIVLNEYKAGTAALSDVIIAETVLYTAQKNAADVQGQRMTAAVGLVKALGGDWTGHLPVPRATAFSNQIHSGIAVQPRKAILPFCGSFTGSTVS